MTELPWLIGCERSGAVRQALRAVGLRAVSCDLVPADDGDSDHIIEDIQEAIKREWAGAILFPDCTYLTVSGLHRNCKSPERAQKTASAIAFVEALWAHRHRLRHLAIENPVGCLSTRSELGRPTQIVQPYQFGDDASKRTCFWIYGMSQLQPTTRVQGRIVEWPRGSGRMVERWDNQTDSGQNRVPPSPDRARLRSVTYPGIAAALAQAALRARTQ